MSILNRDIHFDEVFKKEDAKVCPSCGEKLDKHDLDDVDSDDVFSFYFFVCQNCFVRFRISIPHNPDDWM